VLEHRENAWRFQHRNSQQQMHAGPMTMGPNPVDGDAPPKNSRLSPL
jgi:hypothetical protein